MEHNSDIRWKQRFENFEKAYRLLERTLEIPNPSEAERAGLIHFFEMAFELSWKLMRDYLQEQGFVINSPKQAIKQAFQSDLIRDGHTWIDALNDRNLTLHTYEESNAVDIEGRIRNDYFPLLRQLDQHFRALL